MESFMRKALITIGAVIVIGTFITISATPTQIPTIFLAQQDTPAYAKWGKLAFKETQLKYPNADIIDYLHEGQRHLDIRIHLSSHAVKNWMN